MFGNKKNSKIIVTNLWKHFSKENNMCCSDSYLNANASCNFQIPAIFYLPDIYCYDWVGKSLLLSMVHHNYVATILKYHSAKPF